MQNKDFTKSILVDQTPEEAFAAITNVRGWWSQAIEGDTDKLGAEFAYHSLDVQRSTNKITEFVPGKNVEFDVKLVSLQLEDSVAPNFKDLSVRYQIRQDDEDEESNHVSVDAAPARAVAALRPTSRSRAAESSQRWHATGSWPPDPPASPARQALAPGRPGWPWPWASRCCRRRSAPARES